MTAPPSLFFYFPTFQDRLQPVPGSATASVRSDRLLCTRILVFRTHIYGLPGRAAVRIGNSLGIQEEHYGRVN
jgi:hypothetical protein